MSHRTLERNTKFNLHGPPDLAVEVLSPSTSRRDHGVKRKLYQSSGALEYWVVDPDAKSLRVFRAESDGKFGSPIERIAGRGDTLESALLPGLTQSVVRLSCVLDQALPRG